MGQDIAESPSPALGFERDCPAGLCRSGRKRQEFTCLHCRLNREATVSPSGSGTTRRPGDGICPLLKVGSTAIPGAYARLAHDCAGSCRNVVRCGDNVLEIFNPNRMILPE
jgi:hypothetical protein